MTLTPLTILLIEDNPADARLFQIALVDVGAGVTRIVHVQTLSAALSRLREEQFDVVVLDFFLPDSLGLETVSRVCAHAPDLPLVVLTGLNEETLAQQMLDAGAQGYIPKGQLNGTALLSMLRAAISQKQSTRR
jgi:CheY-like chemotaxis protein